MRDVYVAGTGLTPFRKYEPGSGRKLGREAGTEALRDAGVEYSAVQAVYGGSALPDSPRAVYLARELGITGIPVHHVTNASASGLSALHEGWLAVASGLHDVVLVLGYDVPETAGSAETAIAAQGFAPPVSLFSMWANRRALDVGTTERHLALVAAKNWNYAAANPLALRQPSEPVTVEKVLSSRMIAAPITSMMCTPWGDGAGAAVLMSAEAMARAEGGNPQVAKIAASICNTEVYEDNLILEGAIVGSATLTGVGARAALDTAGVGARDLDVVQVHDAFAIEEIEYCEQIGLSVPGETEELLERGGFGPGSKASLGVAEVSTDGGLIARGHASGGTGLAQVHETLRRFRVADDRVGLTQLVGVGGVCYTQVLTRVEKN
ncbi:thiolase family protein [Rhodococcus sp. 2H158]